MRMTKLAGIMAQGGMLRRGGVETEMKREEDTIIDKCVRRI